MTMAPLAANGKIFVGNSGGELGVRAGHGLDADTGKLMWRAYSTGPMPTCSSDLTTSPSMTRKRAAISVYQLAPDMWQQGGGTVWGWVSYDPDLNLIYYGTSNPGPWNASVRPGANKWTAGIFARDADTGQARWFYQLSPHDLSDYDAVNENVILDITWQGKPRKVLVHPDRNGYVYVIDRMTARHSPRIPFTPSTVLSASTSNRVSYSTTRLSTPSSSAR